MGLFKKKKKSIDEVSRVERTQALFKLTEKINEILTKKAWAITGTNTSYFMAVMEVLTTLLAHNVSNIIANADLKKEDVIQAAIDSIEFKLQKEVEPEPELIEEPAPRKQRR